MMEMFPGARCGTAISMNYVRCAHYVAYRTSLHLQQMWMKREIAEGTISPADSLLQKLRYSEAFLPFSCLDT